MTEQIVYYGVTNHPLRGHGLLNGKEPQLAIKEFIGDTNEIAFLRCPAYQDAMKNVFSISSWFSLDLAVEENSLKSNAPQIFLDSYIREHSVKRKIYQLLQEMMFIAKDDSLEMTQEPASMTDNSFTKSCSVISGTFDIGKHFRLVSCSFFIRNGVDIVEIKEDDSIYYLRFHTKKKIKFVPFFMSPKFEALTLNTNSRPIGVFSHKALDYYYKLFKKKNLKRLLIEEIEKNLL